MIKQFLAISFITWFFLPLHAMQPAFDLDKKKPKIIFHCEIKPGGNLFPKTIFRQKRKKLLFRFIIKPGNSIDSEKFKSLILAKAQEIEAARGLNNFAHDKTKLKK